MSSTEVHSIQCPKCSASLLAGRGTLFLCGNCGNQFCFDGPWPTTRTSSRALISLVLGLMSVVGLFLTGVPAFLLGVSALSSMKSRRSSEILLGRRMAITGATMGALCSLVAMALPIAAIVPIMRYQEQQHRIRALHQEVRQHVADAQWQAASQDYEKILELEPDQAMNWLRCAPLYVQANDTAGYRDLCDRMLARFGDTTTPDVAEKIAKACMIASTDESVLAEASRLADIAVSDPENWAIRYALATRGLALHRNGDQSAAIECCEQSMEGDDEVGRRFRAGNALLIQSMGYAALGQDADAQRVLSEARELVLAAPQTDGNGWHDDLICRILLREAEQAVNPAP